MKREVLLLLGGLLLASASHAASPVIISEFLANNNTSINDDFGNREDWIEIHNLTTNAVNLAGWSLTDTTNNLRQWVFPATNIAANGYMVVYASNRDRRTPGAALHTNFRLNNDGEYLALVEPDGTTIATEFRDVLGQKFPALPADVAYGFATDARDVTLVESNSPARALVPTGDMGTLWTEIGFNDQSWTGGTLGVGYDQNTTGTDYNPFIGLNVGAMYNVNQSVYVRVPFVLTNVTEIDTMNLSLMFEDGMLTYLNGQLLAREGIADPVAWNSGATNRADGTAITPLNINLTTARTHLLIGTNVLAFQVGNAGLTSSDLLLVPRLTARTLSSGSLVKRYFTVPTPGAANNNGVEVLGPLISEATHLPQIPQTNEAITVRAKVRQSISPISNVKLRYRVMYGSEVEVSMFDDGAHGDGGTNDGVFAGAIPGGIAAEGQMIRWYIRATDTSNIVSRLPAFPDALRSPEYFGTITFLAQTNNLEILHWFISNPGAANNTAGTRASLFFLGEFYDNVGINLHGQSSSGFPKKSYDVDFHRGYNFRWAENEMRVDDINLLTIYPDKAHMRNILSYEVFRDAGTPYHFVRPVRVQQNGTFFSDAHMVENGDDNYLERLGMDTQGALYKMYNTLNAATGEKKTRQNEGTEDLQALINGCLLSGNARKNYLFDNLNIAEVTSYLAAQTIIGNTDCCHKNYYLYRDTEGTGEWQILPWDVDLSFGRVWSGTPTYWDDVLYPNTRLFIGDNNTLVAAIYNTPELRAMYLRRLRTLMDELMQPPGTPAAQGKFEQRINELVTEIAPDAALDLAKWGTWCCNAAGPTGGTPPGYFQNNIPQASSWQTLSQAADYLKTNYLPARRTFLFNQQIVGGGGEIPATSQPTNVVINITSIEYSPASSNQAQEYIELRNTNNFAVDLSRWMLTGGIDYMLPPGTVMPANSYLYVSPNVREFRARTSGPRGGQGLFVVGPYQGQLSARGEAVQLSDVAGREVSALAYPGTPSPAQQSLRITELMYHPAPLSGNTNSAEEFEYVELKNIGTNTINLSGVRFTNGISFSFTGSPFTNLAAGASVLVVKNIATFTARYGAGFPIAGQYQGYLDNSGERVTLLDHVGEEILDFNFNNSWYPVTDGLGFSLVVVSENAEPDGWNSKTNWRASGGPLGSPGQPDPPPAIVAPVLINEALTRTIGQPDAIELFNPNTNTVDISGWFLSDDFSVPKKFRIANNTFMQPGTFRVFTESNFNTVPTAATNFALSSDGDEVYIFGADLAGNLNGYYHGFDFGAAEESVSFGRHIGSEGKEHFVAQSYNTLADTNAGPKVGPIVISEIMYRPADIGTNDNTIHEFVELLNIADTNVPLFDLLRPTNTWRLTGGADFSFPTNVWLTSGETLLIVNIAATNPAAAAAFRAQFGLSSGVQLFGPYGGALNNDNDDISLRMPTPPTTNGVPYAIVDRVEYRDLEPWPKAADGFGFSLQRWSMIQFGNDPANWIAAQHSAGAVTQTNGNPPVITAQPTNQIVLAGTTATLSVGVSGTAPLGYQWRKNGANIPGETNAQLVLGNVQPSDAGEYEVISFNALGTAFSQPVTLAVRLPIAITVQPQSIDVRVPPDTQAAATTNVTFTMAASSTAPPIQYQWRRDGTNIPLATNASYTVVGVTTNDHSIFSVRVVDEVSSAESTNVWLYPWVSPIFKDLPISQTVPVGAPVTLSVSFFAWPPPITVEWRQLNTTVYTDTPTDMMSFFTLTAPSTVTSVSYRPVIKNRAAPAGRAPAFTVITTLADNDGDGIPDEWETRHNFNTNSLADATGDADGDGMLNWEEYVAGTNPTNALSKLSLMSLISSNGVNLEFPAMSNKTYSVQYNDALLPTNWQNIRKIIALRSNHTEAAVDPLPASNRFYRVVTPSQ